MTKRVYQPSKTRRRNTVGFRARNSSKKGKLVLKKRRSVGRKKLSA